MSVVTAELKHMILPVSSYTRNIFRNLVSKTLYLLEN